MKKVDLSKIEQVDVREIWDKEDTDFTPWLAQEENIERLGLALGIDLIVVAEEEEVGPFRADILCKDEATEDFVLIENQLEKTDHKHLGQLLTYATGLDAVTIVWIAKEFNDEHRATLDWLNKITDEKHNFFGVKIEILKIDDKMAPNFKVISQPNDWSKSISSAASKISTNELSDTKLKYLEFNNQVCSTIKKNGSDKLKLKKARPQMWHTYPIGKYGTHLAHVFNSRDKWLRAEVYMHKDKNIIKELSKEKEQIEKEFGEKLEWEFLPNRVASRIAIYRSDVYLEKEDQWKDYISWVIGKLEKLHDVFRKRLSNLE
jgi:hypothetical protein